MRANLDFFFHGRMCTFFPAIRNLRAWFANQSAAIRTNLVANNAKRSCNRMAGRGIPQVAEANYLQSKASSCILCLFHARLLVSLGRGFFGLSCSYRYGLLASCASPRLVSARCPNNALGSVFFKPVTYWQPDNPDAPTRNASPAMKSP